MMSCEEYFEKIEGIFDKSEEVKKIEIPEDWDFKGLSDEEKRRDIRDKLEEFNSCVLKIVGQMYKGVLIKEEVSIREDGIYPYRMKYKMSAERLLDFLLKYKGEVENKLNMDVVNFILEKYPLVKEARGKNFIQFFALSEPQKLVLGDERYRSYYMETAMLKAIFYRNGELEFNDLNEREINVHTKELYFIYNKFKSEIDKMVLKCSEEMDGVISDLQAILDDLKIKGGKYLIASNLKYG